MSHSRKLSFVFAAVSIGFGLGSLNAHTEFVIIVLLMAQVVAGAASVIAIVQSCGSKLPH
jgi:hypothetical protein